MIEMPQEALLGAAMLGVVKAEGWMEIPFTFDINLALEVIKAEGGICVPRARAVIYTRDLMDKISEMHGFSVSFDEKTEAIVRILLADAYDRIEAEL